MTSNNKTQDTITTELWELTQTRTGKRILKYAQNDPINKLPQRDDAVFDNVARVLRSTKAKQILIKGGMDPIKLETFRQKWTELRPLFPNQAASLKRNHYSKVLLNEGEAAGKASISITYVENDREEREALQWFNKLGPREGMEMIVKAYQHQGNWGRDE